MSAVDEIKARLDIVDVIGGYVTLQKAGRYFRAPCPFHNERTPSFIVYPDRQSWHCFGACGTGGDVLAFVSRKENLDFSATLRMLAERAGIELDNDGPRRQEAKTLQDANEAAALYFQSMLQNSATARAYVESRGLDQQAITAFQLGFAPEGWDNLRMHLTSRGFAESKLVEAGLLIEGDRGAYDRFRHRLMYPIRDDRGRVVGFGGRILPAAAQTDAPKYMNTPQTPIFDKGAILYALDRSKEEIRRSGTAVIVEGYMDVIAAHQAGFSNVVASMGTSLTERQALLLRRFASRVVLAMDADDAGVAANLRAIQVVASAAEQPSRSDRGANRNLDIRVLALPKGKDPDELIRGDAAAWPAAIEAARPVVDHLIAVTSAGLDLSQPQDRSLLVAEVLPAIGDVRDPVLQAHYLQRLSRLARTSEDALRRQLPRRTAGRQTGSAVTSSDPARAATAARAPREEFCLALLYQAAALTPLADRLDEQHFSLSENRELFRRWRANQPIREEDGALWQHFQRILETRITLTETSQQEEAFLDCIARLQHARMKAVKEVSTLALAEGEVRVKPGQVASIARARMTAIVDEDATSDEETSQVASRLLEDMEAGLQFHKQSRGDEAERTGSAT